MTAVIGYDLSLTATGLAMINLDNEEIYTHRVRSKGKKGATAFETATRIRSMVHEINSWVFDNYDQDFILGTDAPFLAVIESPSFGSSGGAAHERGGLWWGIAGELADLGAYIATVAPTTRAVYATGDGRADKKAVVAAVKSRYHALVLDDNMADAVVLAAMGARFLGKPVDDGLPDSHTRAMAGAKWPALRAAA